MLTVITGCMFAGKSTELIKKIKSFKEDCIVFKPGLDTRYSFNYVVTHDGISIESTPVNDSKLILQFSKNYNIIGIDEAQFFDQDIISVCNILANQNKQVYVCGLSTDYLGRPFGNMPNLLAIADDIIKVYGKCECGNKTTHNKRLDIDKKNQVMLGGENEYKAVCRNCFHQKEQLTIEDLY
jgi:thymidine kinase